MTTLQDRVWSALAELDECERAVRDWLVRYPTEWSSSLGRHVSVDPTQEVARDEAWRVVYDKRERAHRRLAALAAEARRAQEAA